MTATVREVDLRDVSPPVEEHIKASRRKDGKPRKILDPGVIGRVVRGIRAK